VTLSSAQSRRATLGPLKRYGPGEKSMNSTLEPTARRSALMKRVRQRDTEPEWAVRRSLWSIGARYRVNVRGLPGSPDVANRARRKAIFVHGCFWHFHEGCDRGRLPKRNRAFWKKKLEGNRARDASKVEQLGALGFDVLTLWECELADEALLSRLHDFWFQ